MSGTIEQHIGSEVCEETFTNSLKLAIKLAILEIIARPHDREIGFFIGKQFEYLHLDKGDILRQAQVLDDAAVSPQEIAKIIAAKMAADVMLLLAIDTIDGN